MAIKISRKEALGELWRRGVLSYLLDSNQKSLYELFHNTEHRIQTWLLARRSGKSRSLLVLSLEQCQKHPYSIVKYVCPTKLMATQIIRPLMNDLLQDCPDDIKPEFREKDFTYFFKNGSEIQLAGSESGHAQKLRGGSSHIAIIDEAGEVSDLEDIIKNVLLPTTITTNGKILIAGTPPKAPDHDFVKYIEIAEARGSLIRRTVDDNPRLTETQKEEFILELGGRESNAARRELYCEIIRDSSVVVIPEFDDKAIREIVKHTILPVHYDSYVAMDLGYRDLTAIVFAYYDFQLGKIVIQDELVYNFSDTGNNISTLCDGINKKEQSLWMNPYSGEVKVPKKRVSDINHIVTSEMRRLGNISFQNARKDDKEAAINHLRTLISQRKIIIDSRCTNLVRHIKNCKWSNKTHKTTFARDIEDGHYDLVDALIYLIRSVDINANPYPAGYGYNIGSDLHVQNKDQFYRTEQYSAFRTIFNRKAKR